MTWLIVSKCGKYRYHLHRVINYAASPRVCLFIMLNPSTADASEDDPTIRRCLNYAKTWGYDRLEVINLYAFIATYPEDLPLVWGERLGPGQMLQAQISIGLADLIICAWGGKADPVDSEYVKNLF